MTDLKVHVRIRNRLMEVLGAIADAHVDVPACGFDELVNEWRDWAPVDTQELPLEVFTSTEIEGIRSVGEAIERFCVVTPQSIPCTLDTIRLPEWGHVTVVAKQTLAEMAKLGKFFEGDESNA